jgi:hypothetical protein
VDDWFFLIFERGGRKGWGLGGGELLWGFWGSTRAGWASGALWRCIGSRWSVSGTMARAIEAQLCEAEDQGISAEHRG